MDTYVLGVDVWEGALDVDEKILWDAGVRFMIIRLNDMSGGHHKDENFDNQWKQAEGFIRWPYFVYNPWVNQNENLRFLASVVPPDVKHISMDIEVAKPDYPASEYARQVSGFINQACARWSVDIYTGEWFLPYLSSWPKHVNYWCARYPSAFYPPNRTKMAWNELHTLLGKSPWAPSAMPGPCKLWQISGDRLCLPGCADRSMDINVFNGKLEDLAAYAGVPLPVGPKPKPNPVDPTPNPGPNPVDPLPPAPPFEPNPAFPATYLMVYPTADVNVRALPKVDGSRVCGAARNECMVVVERNLNVALGKIGKQDMWLNVQKQDGKRGWVAAWLVSTNPC